MATSGTLGIVETRGGGGHWRVEQGHSGWPFLWKGGDHRGGRGWGR